MVTISPPDYGGGSLVNLVAEIERRMGGSSAAPPLADALASSVPAADTYVLVLFDGLGALQLDHPRAGSLRASCADTLDAPFPTTTTVSLASVATGTPPSAHGLTAYLLWDPTAGTILNTIHMSSAWGDAVDLDLAGFLPGPTVFERLAEQGVEPVLVQPEAFRGTPLTRALYRSTRFEGYMDLDHAVAVTRDVASHRRRFVFVYVPHVDFAAHVTGQRSPEYEKELSAADTFWARLAEALDGTATLLGTADHGHVDIPEDRKVRLSKGALADARVWGDPRVLFVTGDPTGVLAETGGTWTEAAALESLWGPGPLGEQAARRRPDGAVFMPDGWAGFTPYMNDRLIGNHGGLTEAERRIPMLVA